MSQSCNLTVRLQQPPPRPDARPYIQKIWEKRRKKKLEKGEIKRKGRTEKKLRRHDMVDGKIKKKNMTKKKKTLTVTQKKASHLLKLFWGKTLSEHISLLLGSRDPRKSYQFPIQCLIRDVEISVRMTGTLV